MVHYKNPLFTVDSVLFTVADGSLKVLLVKRASEPYVGQWALPGGFVDIELDSSTDETARRKLKEKTSIAPQYLEQLHTISGSKRDPRGFSVTLVYFALIAEQKVTSHIDSVEDVQWINFTDIKQGTLAFDHYDIIQQAHHRLQQKTLYSMIPAYCLPDNFTIGELKAVIEIIIGKEIQRKSLIRRVEAANMFEKLEKKVRSGGRLAHLYRLKKGVDIVHFERNLVI